MPSREEVRQQRRAAAINQRALARAERRRQHAVLCGEVPEAMPLEEFIAWEERRDAEQSAAGSAVATAIQKQVATLNNPCPTTTPFIDRYGRPLFLSGQWAGCSAFLILSGPSINSLDLSLLNRRGIATIGVNNSPALFRPNIWTYVDRANKFHQSIWLDPAVMKVVPDRHLDKPLRQKIVGANGKSTFIQMLKSLPPDPLHPDATAKTALATPRDMPNVVGCRRSPNFDPATWLAEPTVNWGNSKRSAHRNGHPHILNVMLMATKLAYAMGFRTLYLLGCDFAMDARQPYAFQQAKDPGGCGANNGSYRVLNDLFELLKPKFDAAGYQVFNCNPRSGLTVFPFCHYRQAIEAATAHVAQDPLDTEGWYEL